MIPWFERGLKPLPKIPRDRFWKDLKPQMASESLDLALAEAGLWRDTGILPRCFLQHIPKICAVIEHQGQMVSVATVLHFQHVGWSIAGGHGRVGLLAVCTKKGWEGQGWAGRALDRLGAMLRPMSSSTFS